MSYSEWLLRVPGLTRDVGRPTPLWRADRLAAVARAAGRDSGTLRGEAVAALAELEEALAELSDQDLAAPTRNVRYGEEPVSTFFERYVIGHKRAHAAQLRATLGP